MSRLARHHERMKQTDLGLDLSDRRTPNRVFLDEMDRVVPCREFVSPISPRTPTKATGNPPFHEEAMLLIHLLHQRFCLSDSAMEKALYARLFFRKFATSERISSATRFTFEMRSEVV